MKEKVKLLWLVVIAFILLPGCGGEDDEPSNEISATVSEIQGSWNNATYGTYRYITFDGNNYSIYFMKISTSEIIKKEFGTFTLNGTTMTTTKTKGDDITYGELKVYWTNSTKNTLHIYPLGDFLKVN